MNPHTSVKNKMPAGTAACSASGLYQARNIRSQKFCTLKEAEVMISGTAMRSTARYEEEVE
jgi:hypothetical protein